MNWGLLAAAMIIALPTFWTTSDTTEAQEWEEEIQDNGKNEGSQPEIKAWDIYWYS